jgi:hypothetical protein
MRHPSVRIRTLSLRGFGIDFERIVRHSGLLLIAGPGRRNLALLGVTHECENGSESAKTGQHSEEDVDGEVEQTPGANVTNFRAPGRDGT